LNLHESVFAVIGGVIFVALTAVSQLVFAATDPTIIAAALAATGAIIAGIFSLRSKLSADLVDDVMADREYLKGEVASLRSELDAMKLAHREREQALLECRDSETRLRERILELEGAS
jgi:hypothetical protein